MAFGRTTDWTIIERVEVGDALRILEDLEADLMAINEGKMAGEELHAQRYARQLNGITAVLSRALYRTHTHSRKAERKTA